MQIGDRGEALIVTPAQPLGSALIASGEADQLEQELVAVELLVGRFVLGLDHHLVIKPIEALECFFSLLATLVASLCA